MTSECGFTEVSCSTFWLQITMTLHVLDLLLLQRAGRELVSRSRGSAVSGHIGMVMQSLIVQLLNSL